MSVILGLAGLVLAGGRSSRFGAEKAVQRLDGRTLLEWSLQTLDLICAAVAVSAPPGSEAAALAVRLGRMVLPDAADHADGPLAGVGAGLAWARDAGFEHLATLPCDTPMITPDVFETLLPGGYARSPEGPHALCAIWPTGVAADLAARLAAGEHPAVRAFLAEIGVPPVDFDDGVRFANINTPADLAALHGVWTRPDR